MKLILSGPPSIGKTTQGCFLSALLGVPHVSSGNIIRSKAAAGDRHAQEVLSLVSDGSLAPSDAIIEMVTERLSQDDCRDGFVLDGFPRKAVEAQALLDFSPDLRAMLILQAPDTVLLQRVRHRARTSPGRPDDDPEAFPRRMAAYRAETQHVAATMRKAGIAIVEISAEGEPDLISQSIEQIIEGLMSIPDFASLSVPA